MNPNKINLFSTLIALLFISACASQPSVSNDENELVQTTTHGSQPTQVSVFDDAPLVFKTIRINHHKAECEGFWVDQCLMYQNESDTDWSYLYEEIEGFDFVWGHEYELLVEVAQIPSIEGIADQTTTVYRLSRILDDIHHADESFVYSSRHPSTILNKQADGTYKLLDGKQISCGINDCISIDSAIEQQQGIALSLKHNVDPTQPLLLESVLCASSLVSFVSDCGADRG